jgi:tetratricopeptide (TPR) repeat protein
MRVPYATLDRALQKLRNLMTTVRQGSDKIPDEDLNSVEDAKKRRRYFRWVALAFSIFFTVLLAEAAVRIYKYATFPMQPLELVILTAPQIPHGSGIWYEFDGEHNLEYSAKVSYNDAVFRSRTDMLVPKPADEFRIAVYGDSYTECLNSDYPWPDEMQDYLNANEQLKSALGVTHFRVGNFGKAGWGIQKMAYTFAATHLMFEPDLVICAFIDEDALRLMNDNPGEFRSVLNDKHGNALPRHTFENEFVRDLFVVPVPGTDGRIEADFTGGVAQRLWYAKTGNNQRAQKTLFYKGFLIFDVFSDAQLKILDQDEVAVETALDSCAFFNEKSKDFVLLNLPTFYEVLDIGKRDTSIGKPMKYWPMMIKQNPRLRIIPLMRYLPMDSPEADRTTWFVLPWDGHPSNTGATLYGRHAGDAIARYLLAKASGTDFDGFATIEEAEAQLRRVEEHEKTTRNAEVAMKALLAARKRKEMNDPKGALDLYNQAIESNPNIGAPGVIYLERAWILKELGQSGEALRDLDTGIALVQTPKEQAIFYLEKARTKQALGRNQEALKDFDAAIERDPKIGQPGLIFVERARLQAQMGNRQRALEDYDQAIEMDQNPIFLSERDNFKALPEK